MNFNQFIHPRNPFRIRPDFVQLSSKHPELSLHLTRFSNGKCKFNFESADALRTLTRVLLREAYELDVQVPSDRLVPAIPQRLNYLLWLEDIFNTVDEYNEPLTGLDIGTGASCIFPLLGCRLRSNWNFVATELDSHSAIAATHNVNQNFLQHRISVHQTAEESPLLQFVKDGMHVDFVLCNPPFFGSDDEELNLQRMPSAANTAAPVESRCVGGELQFVQRLLNESEDLGDRVRVFSVMLGRKSTFVQLKRMLTERASKKHLQFIHTELCQGKTIRYGLAWTFDLTAPFQKVPCIRHKKEKQALKMQLDRKSGRFRYTYNVDSVKKYVLQALEGIRLRDIKEVVNKQKKCRLQIHSHINTWTKQRKQRRLAKQESSAFATIGGDTVVQDHPMEVVLPEEEVQKIERPGKRRRSSESEKLNLNGFNSIDEDMSKKTDQKLIPLFSATDPKSGHTESSKRLKAFAYSVASPNDSEMFLLHCEIEIKEEEETITVSIRELDRCSNQNSTYEMFQFLMNQLCTSSTFQDADNTKKKLN